MKHKSYFSFHKEERLCSKRLIEALFAGGGKSMSAFPLRVVFMPVAQAETSAPVSIMVSVSKRHFKRAVKRNRVKRQIREGYRLHKHLLDEAMERLSGRHLMIAFLWLSDRLYATGEVERSVKHLLMRVSERLMQSATEVSAHE